MDYSPNKRALKSGNGKTYVKAIHPKVSVNGENIKNMYNMSETEEEDFGNDRVSSEPVEEKPEANLEPWTHRFWSLQNYFISWWTIVQLNL